MLDPTLVVMLLTLGLVFIVTIVAVISTFFTVEQRTTAIVQRLGHFIREAGPGLNIKIPFIDRIAGLINLRV